MFLARDGRSCAVIVLGSAPTWIERHAAAEFARWVHAASGAHLEIVDAPIPGVDSVAIGRPETNPVIAGACGGGLLRLSSEEPGLDGFVVRRVQVAGASVLCIGGSQDRGTLYGVYAAIEQLLGVGFFRDGDRVPHRPTVEVGGIELYERPRFAGRHDGNGCMYTYSALCWSWEDWKREIDWKVQRRQNTTYAMHELDNILVQEVLRGWGVEVALDPVSPRLALQERALEYARNLGIRVPCHLPVIPVSDALLARFPECRVIASEWGGFAATRCVHPADPLFHRFVVDLIRLHEERYGSDHLYFAGFLSEARLDSEVGDRHQAWLEYARRMSAAMLDADPQATWLVETWSFDLENPNADQRWSPAQAREYVETIGVPLVVYDLWSEEGEKYRHLDYMWGKPWGFGVLETFGGHTFLHGDVGDLVDRMHEIVDTPIGEHSDWFVSGPEIVDFNGFYLDLAAVLSWDPGSITVPGYIDWYGRARYGEAGARVFARAMPHLLETAYGPNSGSIRYYLDPLYWYIPRPDLYVGDPLYRDVTLALRRERVAFIPRLRAALEVLAGEWDAFEGSELASRDLVDIARLWIAERFNARLRDALDAFGGGDAAGLEAASRDCLALLDQQVRLLATVPAYRLHRRIEAGRANYGDDAARVVKHSHAWVYADDAHESLDLRDYYRMDLDGLVRDYYRPRIAAYLAMLRERLHHGLPEPDAAEIEAVCAPFTNAFVATSTDPLPCGESAIAVVRGLLAEPAGAR